MSKVVMSPSNIAFSRLPELAADLVRRKVSVIATPGVEIGARAAKAATSTIPVIFGVSEDPVRMGLVASLARPGGNATGINFLSSELLPKRVGVLRELLPGINRLGVLINPGDVSRAESIASEVQAAARSMGQDVYTHKADTSDQIDEAFAAFARSGWMRCSSDLTLSSTAGASKFALMAVRHMIPAIYGAREYVEAGGLMSYGANLVDMFREVGVYTGKVLKGDQAGGPASRTVEQIRASHQPASRQGARPGNPADPARPCRRGD